MKNNTLQSSIADAIQNFCGISKGATLIVGISGGPDSVFLLHMLNKLKKELQLSLVVAHMDHGWRPESEKEAQFCRDISKKIGVPCVVRKLSEFSLQLKFNGSKEEFARKARRAFFEELCTTYQADAIALAHHADDQKETFFIRLLRGASLTGLAGMRMRHGHYIRPLLNLSKKNILEYLHMHGIEYCIDETNESNAYLRNRIRNTLLPVINQVDTRAQETITRTMKQLQQTEEYLQKHTLDVWHTIAHQENGIWHVEVDKFLSLHNAMRHRLFVHWFSLEKIPYVPTQKFFAEIERFLSHSQDGTHDLHTQWGLKKYKGYVCITLAQYNH